MPELPEVEVVKKSLKNVVNNLTIKDVQINDGNLRYKLTKQQINQIIGSKILNIKRRSKYLLFFLNKGLVMVVHLGMTGKFFIVQKNNIKQKTSFYYNIDKTKNFKHDRVLFFFKNRLKLIYNDIRKFGFIKIEPLRKINNNLHLKKLGPEPLSNSFNLKYFKKKIFKKKRPIKNLLMDQKFVSGLGNIYVNEILFYSKVKPCRKIHKLKDKDLEKLLKFTKKILKKAITFGGSSIKDFSSSLGKKGNFQEHFAVYGRKGQMCSNTDCNGIVRKIVISNRAIFFCPKCQK